MGRRRRPGSQAVTATPTLRLHRGLCLAALALLPALPALLPHHYQPIPTFHQEWSAAALSLVALTWLLRPGPDGRVDFPEIAWLPLGLLGIAIAQGLLPGAALPERLLMFALYLVWAGLMMLLGRRLTADLGLERLADLLAAALLAGALFQALCGFAQATGVARLPWVFVGPAGGLRGNVGQPNNLADLLWLGVASGLYLRSRGLLGWPVASAALLCLIPIALLSGSRAIWLYATALLVLSAVWGGPARRSLLVGSALALALTVAGEALLVTGLLAPPNPASSAGARLAASGGGDPVRGVLWSTAWRIFLENPLLGAGFGQTTRQFLDHVLQLPPRSLPGLPEHVHNLPLQVLTELGIVAGALLVVLGLRWARDRWRQERDCAGWWIAATATIVALHSLLEYPLWYGFFLAPAALVAGAASGRAQPLQLGPRIPLLIGAVVVLGSMLLAVLRSDYALLEDTVNGRLPGNGPQARQEAAAAALSRLAGQALLRPYVDLTTASLMDDSAAALEIKRATCSRALAFSASREIVFKCAYLEALGGDLEGATLALRRAAAAYPDQAKRVQADWAFRAGDDPLRAMLLARLAPGQPATSDGTRPGPSDRR